MLRARPIAGDPELGAALEREVIGPFVYRREVDPNIASGLTDMVLRSRAELSVHPARDLKLGPGGIREAEFFVQTLQLIWGGQGAEPARARHPDGARTAAAARLRQQIATRATSLGPTCSCGAPSTPFSGPPAFGRICYLQSRVTRNAWRARSATPTLPLSASSSRDLRERVSEAFASLSPGTRREAAPRSLRSALDERRRPHRRPTS